MHHICEYGCGQETKHQLKNGKWCCSKRFNSCPGIRKKQSISMKGKKTGPCSEETKRKISEALKGRSAYNKGIPCPEETKRKISETKKGQPPWNTGKYWSEEHKKKMSETQKFNLKDYKEKYPFFCKVEELRETKDGKIQVRCKNHNCKNSKEKGGWFTPTYNQLYERIRQIEKDYGNGGSYLYCSQKCKDTCPLYHLHGDPYRDTNLPYTYAEYLTCRAVVFERENTLCEYCGEPATDMHHIFSVKLEPFFALDPDYCIACCEKHHYKYAHKDECSTGNLAKIVCSVESQKFLEQKINI